MYHQAEKRTQKESEEVKVVSDFMTQKGLIINLHAKEYLKRLMERIKLKCNQELDGM